MDVVLATMIYRCHKVNEKKTCDLLVCTFVCMCFWFMGAYDNIGDVGTTVQHFVELTSLKGRAQLAESAYFFGIFFLLNLEVLLKILLYAKISRICLNYLTR